MCVLEEREKEREEREERGERRERRAKERERQPREKFPSPSSSDEAGPFLLRLLCVCASDERTSERRSSKVSPVENVLGGWLGERDVELWQKVL